MFDYQAEVFHVGILVPDIHAAMAEYGASMGCEWSAVMERADQRVWTPEAGQQLVNLKAVYSTRGPQYLELIEGQAGTFWDPASHDGIHHMGAWADVPALTDDLIERGWTFLASQVSPEEGYGSFTYLRSPTGMILEPVAQASRERLLRWFSGATSPDA